MTRSICPSRAEGVKVTASLQFDGITQAWNLRGCQPTILEEETGPRWIVDQMQIAVQIAVTLTLVGIFSRKKSAPGIGSPKVR